MQKASDNLFSTLKLVALMLAAGLVTGCISAKNGTAEVAIPAKEPVVVKPVVVEPAEIIPEALTSWTVVAGNNLWGIACKEEVYDIPEKWPLIYKANLDQIEDPDLIYPGQVLSIPRNSSRSQVDAAVDHAKIRGAWAVGPIEASDKVYLRNSS